MVSAIGKGSFGQVFKAIHKSPANGSAAEECKYCAIKSIEKKCSPNLGKILTEVSIHLRLKNDNILQLFNRRARNPTPDWDHNMRYSGLHIAGGLVSLRLAKRLLTIKVKPKLRQAYITADMRDLSNFSPFACDLICRLLAPNPTDRPLIEDILNHPLIEGPLTTDRLLSINKTTKDLQLAIDTDGNEFQRERNRTGIDCFPICFGRKSKIKTESTQTLSTQQPFISSQILRSIQIDGIGEAAQWEHVFAVHIHKKSS
ncbi:unnamed protein product [Medioppia subpectinata]|uniref:Protein kinase domain-containing protein n=1 Tax=Medioppia subpectinata TaxID=1979941 RepID=A0A7R9KXM4_9ACAR|nr:unnamed protein product [Medioppia subpectinata]CAG2110467.1 unnamed protein product [Medioppia subpectinata]